MVVAIRVVAVHVQVAVGRQRPVEVLVAVRVVEHGADRHRVVVGDPVVDQVLGLVAHVAELDVHRPGQLLVQREAPGVGQRHRVVVELRSCSTAPGRAPPPRPSTALRVSSAGAERPDPLTHGEQAGVERLRLVVAVHADAAADHGLAASLEVPGEADARGHVEPAAVHAGERRVRVDGGPGDARVRARAAAVVRPVEGRHADARVVRPGPEVREAQAVVEGQAGLDLPGVLDVGLAQGVVHVVDRVLRRLAVVHRAAPQEVGERVARASRLPRWPARCSRSSWRCRAGRSRRTRSRRRP